MIQNDYYTVPEPVYEPHFVNYILFFLNFLFNNKFSNLRAEEMKLIIKKSNRIK